MYQEGEEEEEGEEAAEEETSNCYFDGMDGFKCGFPNGALRTCFGKSGNQAKPTCTSGECTHAHDTQRYS